MIKIGNRSYKILRRVQKFLQNLEGKITLGVRVIVINKKREILMVKHTYTPGWYLPGGGIKRRETPFIGMVRETWEETGVYVIQAKLISVLYHEIHHVPDHLFLYQASAFAVYDNTSPEILEKKWWPLTKLPPDMHQNTKHYLQLIQALPVRGDK